MIVLSLTDQQLQTMSIIDKFLIVHTKSVLQGLIAMKFQKQFLDLTFIRMEEQNRYIR